MISSSLRACRLEVPNLFRSGFGNHGILTLDTTKKPIDDIPYLMTMQAVDIPQGMHDMVSVYLERPKRQVDNGDACKIFEHSITLSSPQFGPSSGSPHID